jgi:DNA-binding transcriptional LysR family regulator
VAAHEAATVRLGITPPAAFTIAPHLVRHFNATQPELSVEVHRMWLPHLVSALMNGTVDVALTCGDLRTQDPNVATVEIGSERLLIGLRRDHPLSAHATIDLQQLQDQRLGMHAVHLFPAWHAVQRSILAAAGLAPSVAEINDPDLTARRWTLQPEIEWIMLIGSLLADQEDTVARPAPAHAVPFTLSWHKQSVIRPAVHQFIAASRSTDLPADWLPPRKRERRRSDI